VHGIAPLEFAMSDGEMDAVQTNLLSRPDPSFPRKRESMGFAHRRWTLAFARVTVQ
jgi:hypothetical protein